MKGKNLMSRAFGLCKFKKTGNIYWCCYNGTTDIMLPRLLTTEQALDEDGYINVITKIYYDHDEGWDALDKVNPNNIDEVEIYSDYGYGFSWRGTGSELDRMIISELNFGENVTEYEDGKPDWVKSFLKKVEDEMET